MSYDTEPQGGQEQRIGFRPVCQVQEQKELPDGLKDDICGRVVPSGYAGLCRYALQTYTDSYANTALNTPKIVYYSKS